jgi:hypothetical protein
MHRFELANELAAAGFDTIDATVHAGSDASGHAARGRLAYKGYRASFMQRLQRAGSLLGSSDDEVARRFENEVATRVQAGRSVLKLPQRRRVANQVAKLRTEILARS